MASLLEHTLAHFAILLSASIFFLFVVVVDIIDMYSRRRLSELYSRRRVHGNGRKVLQVASIAGEDSRNWYVVNSELEFLCIDFQIVPLGIFTFYYWILGVTKQR